MLLVVNLTVFLSGCAPIIIGGVAAGGYTVLKDKKIGDSINDTKIETNIKRKLYSISPSLYSSVSVVVDQGCVLLTGGVSNPEWVNHAEKEAWSVTGVNSVNNNVFSGEEIPMSQILKDGYITSACRSSLMCTLEIKSVNYKIKTMNGVVYILGKARSKIELNKVLSKIQNIKGVKKIVSYVNIIEK